MWYAYKYTFNIWVWLSTILESMNINGDQVKYPGTKKHRHNMHMTEMLDGWVCEACGGWMQ